MRYIDLIRIIKAAPDGFYFENMSGDTHSKVSRLHRIGCIDLDVEERYEDNLRHRLIATVANRNAPNPPQIATPASVQVQWWYDAKRHTGKRLGQFSQDTYKVVSQDDKWTKILDTLGRPHVVANSRVRVAA